VDLINPTSLRAALFTGFLGPTAAVGTVVARATFRLGDDGGLLPSASGWPILLEPLWTEVGTFPSDMVPGHAGCALVATGVLRREEPVTSARVTVKAGAFLAELDVVGDRVWQARGEELVASEPEPFTEMPLAWTRAFGGASDYEGTEAPYVLNAKGRGFYLKREEAAGKPLPNLEWPDQRISKWDDRPLPGCFGPVVDPVTWYLADVSIDAKKAKEAGDEAAFDEILLTAHERCAISACQPRMIAPEVRPSDELSVEGVDARPVRFRVPAALPVVRVEPGTGSFEAPLAVSGIFLLLSQRLVVMTYRTKFEYPYERRKRRRAILSLGVAT
jgi:hypothetical protein